MDQPQATFEQTFKSTTMNLTPLQRNGNLAVKYNHGDADAGRATLGAALMLKGWIELYAASPDVYSGQLYPLSDFWHQHFATADCTVGPKLWLHFSNS